MKNRPRLLIEEWLPAQAIGVECARERATGQQPPDKRLHVWWARRPLTASRAAVLASVLPADYDREIFERLIGLGRPSHELVSIRARMDAGERVDGSFGCGRAFTNAIREEDIANAHTVLNNMWGELPTIIDPMSGGGSIPLESARLGFTTYANEYNPVACTVLEATIDYPFRFGGNLTEKTRKWSKIWGERVSERLIPFFPKEPLAKVHAYIYVRTVPCPDTGYDTPLCPDWTLLKSEGRHVVAEPIIDRERGTWTVKIREVGKNAGQLKQTPNATYGGGKGISLFSQGIISDDYIKAMAQSEKMGRALYAIATKATTRLEFRPAEENDIAALKAATHQLLAWLPDWERDGIIPTERIPEGSKTGRYNDDSRGTDLPLKRGEKHWSDMFSHRQLLGFGILVEELKKLRPEIIDEEDSEIGEAIIHLLSFALDKFLNWNAALSSWNVKAQTLRSVFDRHDFSFKITFAEMAPYIAGGGFSWAIDSVLDAFEKITQLSHSPVKPTVSITQGSATNLVHLDDKSITAVVVDPPYADNVQYSELADFFYVWLKRTQGHRRPEWFSSYLCDHTEEAVTNVSRHRKDGMKPAQAKIEANAFYQKLMSEVFTEAHRVLRDDGALTVMFTHKKQEAWAALFDSLIAAGFTITATWPVQTESQHSLHQANKNAAQSTVILVARKRDENAGRGYLDDTMQAEIVAAAQGAAARLKGEGLNAVDQLVGAFGPAMEVFTQYREVRTDTGEKVSVAEAIQLAANSVAQWRVDQLAERGMEGVDAESRFMLLCWDVLGAAEFRFNEAMLLGRSVGMDVTRLKEVGLIEATGDKVKLLPASERRRDTAIRSEQEQLDLFGGAAGGRGRKVRVSRKVHPNDEFFASSIDACHALALKHAESGGGSAGIGAAKGTAIQQGWGPDSPCARLMTALVQAAPQAVRFPGKGKTKTAADKFPEFRAWHAMLKPLFGIDPPEWKEPTIAQQVLAMDDTDEDEDDEEEEGEE